MTKDEQNRLNILSKLPDELLQTEECKLIHSFIDGTPQSAWRRLDYSDNYDSNSINVYITHRVNGTYFALVVVYISGSCYDYFKAPKGSAYPHVDIAYQIANYLKILGLQIYDH